MTIDAGETYGRPENFTPVPRTRSEDERLFNTGDERTFADRTGRASAPEEVHYDPDFEDDDPDGTGDPEGWGMLAAGTGGLIAIGVGVWLFSWGGWIAVLTTSAVLGVAGGGTYVAAADRRRNGPRTPRMRRTSWGGSPSTSRSAGGRSRSGSGLKFPNLLGGRSASTPKPTGRSAAPARTATRSHKPTAGSGRVAPAARTGRAGAAARPSGGAPRFPGRPSAAAARSTPSASPRSAPAAKSKLRRGMVALGTGVAAGADAYARYQKARQNKRFAHGKRAKVGPLAWMMLSALEGLSVYLRDGTAPGNSDKNKPAKKRKKKTTAKPHPAAGTAPTATSVNPRRESLNIEIPTPTRSERAERQKGTVPYSSDPLTPDEAESKRRFLAAVAAARTRTGFLPPTRPDDERDSDHGYRQGADTIPPAHRTEFTMLGRPNLTMTHSTAAAHPYTEQLVEASTMAFAYFQSRIEEPDVHAATELETFTDALGSAFRSLATDITMFAAWLEGEFPTYPGLANYYQELGATFIASAEAADEAMTAHRSINAPDFERMENPRPNEAKNNVPVAGVY